MRCKNCAFFLHDSIFEKPPEKDPVVAAAEKAHFDNWDSFFAEVNFLSHVDLLRLTTAYIIAKSAHGSVYRSEVRSGVRVRYFEHVREAALIAIREYGITDIFTLMMIFLHDIGEDSKRISADLLTAIFDSGQLAILGKSVASSVSMLTKISLDAYFAQLENFGIFEVLRAKFFDRMHNLRTVSPAKRMKQVEETEQRIYPLCERMVRIAPPAYAPTTTQMYKDLIETVAQLKADAQKTK